MRRLEAGCEKLVHLFVNGSFYGMPGQAKAFSDAFHLIALKTDPVSRYIVWSNLRMYPALLLVYASGVAAIAAENYSVLREIACRPSVIAHGSGRNLPAPIEIETHRAMDRDMARQLFENRNYTPVSDHLLEYLRDALATMSVDEAQYIEVFDNFEYLWCILHVDAGIQLGSSNPWAPYGSFIWRWRRHSGEGGEQRFVEQAARAIKDGDNHWLPINAGLFGGDLRRLQVAKEFADLILAAIGREMR